MEYTFTEKLFREGNRSFIKIPFNVWEECGKKGLVPVRVTLQDCVFECRLIPKGDGIYYIPVTKNVMNKIDSSGGIKVSFEVLSGLTRINHDSPYSKENPIRRIDSIQSIAYDRDGYCGQLCIAMLTGLSVEEISDIMQARAWQCSFSKLIETLDYFGIAHDDKVVYTRGKEVPLPECCIVNAKAERMGHFALYYKGKYYGGLDIEPDKITGYLRIVVE